jgi:hypothetical protein
MAKQVKITEKFSKVSESYTVTTCDNGFLVDIGGQNTVDDWINVKIVVHTLDELYAIVQDLAWMPKT